MSTEHERGTRTEDGRVLGLKALAVLFLLAGAWACTFTGRGSVEVNEWWARRGPVVPHDSFPGDCRLCHVGDDWLTLREDFSFDHLAETGVPLEGAHARAECLRCHNDRGPAGVFAARGCAGCHGDVHQGKLGMNCVDCHGQENWRPLEPIALHERTGFPLVGAHAAAACWRCHPGAEEGLFIGVDSECASCHGDDLARAQSPDHAAQGWTSGCDECHIPTTWSGPGFNHATFPLVGTHGTLDCAACHAGGVFAGTPQQCVDCHLGAYQAATDPDHVAAGFPTSCESCHVPTSWSAAVFDHRSWALTGAHTAASCSACHVGGVFAGTPQDCASCHLDDFNASTDPDHVGQGFPTTCDDCHSTLAWRPAHFGHKGWPLTGAHASADCTACHAGGVYSGLPSSCVDCHLRDYTGATNPDHAAAGFPQSCEVCHNTVTWRGASFDHSFPIDVGNHSNLSCSDCHLVPRNFTSFSCTHCHEHNRAAMGKEHVDVRSYQWLSSACYACHPSGDR